MVREGVCMMFMYCLPGAGQAETVSTSLTAGGQVKGLGVVESDVDNLSVTVTDTSGRQCSNAGLTTLPNGQLGT